MNTPIPRKPVQRHAALPITLLLLSAAIHTTLAHAAPTAGPDKEARVQLIHNAADPALGVVDIYINGALWLGVFAFRTATPYVDLPAGFNLSVAIAPGNSTGADDALATFDLVLEDGETYVLVVSGVRDPAAFAPNPEGRPTGLALWVKQGVRESIRNQGSVGYIVGHGATDAPALDVRLRELGRRAEVASGAAYGDLTALRALPAKAYTMDLSRAGTNAVIGSYEADFRPRGGAGIVLLTSGFLNPPANRNGAGFALLSVLPSGLVVELPLDGATDPLPARVQFIHNAADPNLGLVDIYVNDALAFDDMAFREATAFLDLTGRDEVAVVVASPASTTPEPALATFTVPFLAGETYIAIFEGVLEPDNFARNPDARPTRFELHTRSGARELSTSASEIQFFASHGVTDAPTIDVHTRTGATLADDLAYSSQTDYVGVPPRAYTLDVTTGDAAVLASFTLDLSTLAGGAAVVLASGFLTPQANQDGDAFALIAVLPDGTVVTLPAARPPTQPPAKNSIAGRGLYPNPFNPVTTIRFDLPGPAEVSVDVFDMLGRKVLSIPAQMKAAGPAQRIQVDGSPLASGLYLYRVTARMEGTLHRYTGPMTLIK